MSLHAQSLGAIIHDAMWVERIQELDQIHEDLREHFPNLHLFINNDGLAEIGGIFPVRGVDGLELDRYSVKIVLSQNYPKDLPVVFEVGRRIPWELDFHVNESTGEACVVFPDDRWHYFPIGASLLDYLKGPLYNYFLSQTIHTETGKWPFGGWGHGVNGVIEYYCELLQTDDELTVHRYLYVLEEKYLKRNWDCPCGSGMKIKSCCHATLNELRKKIPYLTARNSYMRLGLQNPPYSGPKLQKPRE